MTEPEDGDSYIDDKIHYQLSVVSRCIIADVDHENNALWHWVHSEHEDPKSYMIRAKREIDCPK